MGTDALRIPEYTSRHLSVGESVVIRRRDSSEGMLLPRIVLPFAKLVSSSRQYVKTIDLRLEAALTKIDQFKSVDIHSSSGSSTHCLAKMANSIAPPHVEGFRIVRIYSSRGRLSRISSLCQRQGLHPVAAHQRAYPRTTSGYSISSFRISSATTRFSKRSSGIQSFSYGKTKTQN